MVEVVRAGRSPGALAREFGPPANTIRKWATQADIDEGLRADGLTTAERNELRELRRENKQLKREREILSLFVLKGWRHETGFGTWNPHTLGTVGPWPGHSSNLQGRGPSLLRPSRARSWGKTSSSGK